MCQSTAVATFSAGESAEELDDALAKVDRQAQDGAQLNHNRVHLPVAAIERHVQERFCDAQVRRRADRQELGESFNNSQKYGKEIIVQCGILACCWSSGRGQSLAHFPGIEPPQIVTAKNAGLTIAV